MKNKELKTLWKLAKSFWIAGTIFWIIETIIFLIIEGWHYKATNPIEIYCDKIVSNMWLAICFKCNGCYLCLFFDKYQ